GHRCNPRQLHAVGVGAVSALESAAGLQGRRAPLIGSRRWLRGAKSLEGKSREHDEDRHDNQLGKPKGRGCLRGCNSLQRRDLGEELRKQDKDIEVESKTRGDDISSAPGAGEVATV